MSAMVLDFPAVGDATAASNIRLIQASKTLGEGFKKLSVATTQAQTAIARVIASLPPQPVDQRCDYSWLYESQCAHCLGHVADWEEPRKRVADER